MVYNLRIWEFMINGIWFDMMLYFLLGDMASTQLHETLVILKLQLYWYDTGIWAAWWLKHAPWGKEWCFKFQACRVCDKFSNIRHKVWLKLKLRHGKIHHWYETAASVLPDRCQTKVQLLSKSQFFHWSNSQHFTRFSWWSCNMFPSFSFIPLFCFM